MAPRNNRESLYEKRSRDSTCGNRRVGNQKLQREKGYKDFHGPRKNTEERVIYPPRRKTREKKSPYLNPAASKRRIR